MGSEEAFQRLDVVDAVDVSRKPAWNQEEHMQEHELVGLVLVAVLAVSSSAPEAGSAPTTSR